MSFLSTLQPYISPINIEAKFTLAVNNVQQNIDQLKCNEPLSRIQTFHSLSEAVKIYGAPTIASLEKLTSKTIELFLEISKSNKRKRLQGKINNLIKTIVSICQETLKQNPELRSEIKEIISFSTLKLSNKAPETLTNYELLL